MFGETVRLLSLMKPSNFSYFSSLVQIRLDDFDLEHPPPHPPTHSPTVKYFTVDPLGLTFFVTFTEVDVHIKHGNISNNKASVQ